MHPFPYILSFAPLPYFKFLKNFWRSQIVLTQFQFLSREIIIFILFLLPLEIVRAIDIVRTDTATNIFRLEKKQPSG